MSLIKNKLKIFNILTKTHYFLLSITIEVDLAKIKSL